MRNRIVLLLCAGVLLLATACRSSRQAVGGEPPVATAEGEGAPQREYTIITLEGTAEGLSFNAQVRMAKDSIIWANATKVLELARAMCTPDSVWVNVPLFGGQKQGTYADVERYFGVATSFEELQAILESPNPEKRITELAETMGVRCKVRVVKREKADRLTFPYVKRRQ